MVKDIKARLSEETAQKVYKIEIEKIEKIEGKPNLKAKGIVEIKEEREKNKA